MTAETDRLRTAIRQRSHCAPSRSRSESSSASASHSGGRRRRSARTRSGLQPSRLPDRDGAPVSLSALRGRPVIITFIDPLYRDFCPIEAQHLNDVVNAFPQGSKPAIVAVSVNVYGNAHTTLMQDARKWKLLPEW